MSDALLALLGRMNFCCLSALDAIRPLFIQ